MLTISELIQIGGREGILARGANFTLGDTQPVIQEDKIIAYYVMMSDPNTGVRCPLTWSVKDDARDTAYKINVASALIDNGVDALRDLIASQVQSYE